RADRVQTTQCRQTARGIAVEPADAEFVPTATGGRTGSIESQPAGQDDAGDEPAESEEPAEFGGCRRSGSSGEDQDGGEKRSSGRGGKESFGRRIAARGHARAAPPRASRFEERYFAS